MCHVDAQKQPIRGVFRKSYSGNMQEIYRTHLLRDFIQIIVRCGYSVNLLHIFTLSEHLQRTASVRFMNILKKQFEPKIKTDIMVSFQWEFTRNASGSYNKKLFVERKFWLAFIRIHFRMQILISNGAISWFYFDCK